MEATRFAPAERATAQSLKENFESLQTNEYVKTVFDALPEVVAILKKERQIVFRN